MNSVINFTFSVTVYIVADRIEVKVEKQNDGYVVSTLAIVDDERGCVCRHIVHRTLSRAMAFTLASAIIVDMQRRIKELDVDNDWNGNIVLNDCTPL